MPEEIQTDKDGIVQVEYDKSEKADAVRIDYGGVLTTLAVGAAVAMSPIGILLPIDTALKALRKRKQPKPTHTDNIIQIIKTGKAQDVKEMEIEVDKSIAGKIDLSLLEDLGVDLEIERQNITLIKVKYA